MPNSRAEVPLFDSDRSMIVPSITDSYLVLRIPFQVRRKGLPERIGDIS